MGNNQAQTNYIEVFSKIPEPIQIQPADNQQYQDLLRNIHKILSTEGSDAMALFVNTHAACMRILLQILKHPNSQPETVSIGFQILNLFVSNDTALKSFMGSNGIEFLSKLCSNYDFNTPGKISIVRQSLQLIIKILKRDAKVADILCDSFISLLSPILMETSISSSNKEKIEVVRVTCQVFSELTDIQNKNILTQVSDLTGIVANFVLLLGESADNETIGYALNTVKNLSSLKAVQANNFLIRNGVPAVIKILERSQGNSMQWQASKALRMLCKSRNQELAQQLNASGAISKLLKILNLEATDKEQIKDKDIKAKIYFYCKLCLLELCYNPENQKEIEVQGGVEHFTSLAFFEPSNSEEKYIFSQTLLEFTKRSSWVQITEIFPFFVKILVKYMRLTAHIPFEQNTSKEPVLTKGKGKQSISKQDMIDLRYNEKIQKVAVKALRNLSLNSSSHKAIFRNENLPILIPYMQRVRDLVKSFQKDGLTTFDMKNGELYLATLKAMTNCLMNTQIRSAIATYEEDGSFKATLIDEFFAFLHSFHQIAESDQQLLELSQTDKDLRFFLNELQNECTLSLLMIEVSSQENGDFVSSATDESKAQYLMHIMKSEDINLVCKSLNILASLAENWQTTVYLYQTKIIKILKMLIMKNEPSITREVAHLISQMLSKPENMVIWLKMDASNTCVNSAAGDSFMILQQGAPKRLPKDRGMYRNWGVFFNDGDILGVTHGGLEISTHQWTISVWITLPVMKSASNGRHILVAPSRGKGIYLMIDETGSRLGSIDEVSGLFIDSGNDLTKYRKGWHSVIVTCDNQTDCSINYYIDGKSMRDSQQIQCCQPIGFIGNSSNGIEPFGTFSDLRIYQSILSPSQIQDQAKYHDELGINLKCPTNTT